jgi:hypothetical protein
LAVETAAATTSPELPQLIAALNGRATATREAFEAKLG